MVDHKLAVLNVPDRPMNVFSHNVVEELQAIVQQLQQARDVKVVVFRSGTEVGCAAPGVDRGQRENECARGK